MLERIRRGGRVAIGPLLISAATALGGCRPAVTRGELLYERHFHPYPIVLSPEAIAAQPELAAAYEAYRSGRYDTVVAVTRRYTDGVARVPLVMMALAMGYMHEDSLAAADDVLAVLEAHPDLGDDASWYRGLILVRRGEFARARGVLATAKRHYDRALSDRVNAVIARLPPGG